MSDATRGIKEGVLMFSTLFLERTGNVDALPAPGEQPGPDSRERYDLKVTPTGVEIRGRSSATKGTHRQDSNHSHYVIEAPCHSERSEESRMSRLPASRARFLASLGMTSSKSLPLHLCSTPAGGPDHGIERKEENRERFSKGWLCKHAPRPNS